MMVVCYFCDTMLGFDDPHQRVGGVIVAGEHLCRSCQQKFRALKKAQDAYLKSHGGRGRSLQQTDYATGES